MFGSGRECDFFSGPVDGRVVLLQPVHPKDYRIIVEGYELEGVEFKVVGGGLHDDSGGVLGGVDGSVGEGNIEALLSKGEVMELCEILVNKGDGGTRVDHCMNWEGGTVKI